MSQEPGTDEAKLTIEKFADGGIACMRFLGTIDEGFDGKTLATTVRCDTLLLDLGGVKKISSFGIREWVDFITAASKQAGSIVLVECGPKIVDQLNMVANFAGAGRVYSFYAPYRCDYCDAEHRVLLTADRDHEAIKAMKLGNRPCPTCKDAMYFDEDPASFFSYLLTQDKVEISAEVESFLATRLNYAVSEVARKLRLDKLIEGRLTYVRLAGDLDAGFPRDKLADGLEGPVVLDVTGIGRIEPAGAAEWRSFLQLVTPLVEQLFIVGAGPSFLEKLTRRDDLGPKAVVLSCSLPYRCAACGNNRTHTIDVAQSYDAFRLGKAPEQRCAHCKAAMEVAATEPVLAALPALPKPNIPADLAKAIAELVARKIEKKKAPTAGAIPVAAAPPAVVVRGGGVATGVVSALVVVLLLGGGALAYRLFTRSPAVDLGKVTAASDPVRPTWVPEAAFNATASCSDIAAGLACVGASSLTPLQDDALEEARDVVLDAIAESVATRIKEERWRSAAAVWQATRAAKLAALEANPQSSQARREVRQARRAVAELLLAGGVVSPTPSARYWEERANRDGKQVQAYAQIVVPRAALENMVAGYARPTEVMGATVVDMFPLVGWRFPDVANGAILVRLGDGRLKQLGLLEQFLVLEVGGRKVVGGAGLAKLLPEEIERLGGVGGALELTVQAGDTSPRTFTEQIAKRAAPTGPRSNTGSKPSGGKLENVNVWDRVGGGDRDDPTQ